jgi:hypothetical protein
MKQITLDPKTDSLLPLTPAQLCYFFECDGAEQMRVFRREDTVLFCAVAPGTRLSLLEREMPFADFLAELQPVA